MRLGGENTSIWRGPGDVGDRQAIKGTVQLHTVTLDTIDSGLRGPYGGRV